VTEKLSDAEWLAEVERKAKQLGAALERQRIRRAQNGAVKMIRLLAKAAQQDIRPDELPRIGVLKEWFREIEDRLALISTATRAPRAKRGKRC